MNTKMHPPIFVPREFRREMECLSKAALMDVVWDLCERQCATGDLPAETMAEYRKTREIIVSYRKAELKRRA